MAQWGGQARFVWNAGVARVLEVFDHPQAQPRHSVACDRDSSRQRRCKEHGCPPLWMPQWLWQQAWDAINSLSGISTELRREHDWLAAGPSEIQQDVERDLRKAFVDWLDPSHPARRPRFHRHGGRVSFNLRRSSIERAGDSYTPHQGGGQLNAKWRVVRVPKVGLVKLKFRTDLGESLPADLSSARVVREPSGDWFISFTESPPARDHQPSGVAIGIDMGRKTSVAVHDGTEARALQMPGLLTDPERKRLLRLEREAARRYCAGGPQSNNWHKTQHRIARLRAVQVRRRNDWIEKTTTKLVDEADIICREDLRVRNMTRSAKGTADEPGTNVKSKSGLNRAILEQAWGRFAKRLDDKAAQAGLIVVAVNPRNTSLMCHECGHIDKANRPTRDLFCCVACGHQEDADANAAANIRTLGLSSVRRRQGMSSLRGRHESGKASDTAGSGAIRETSMLALETLTEGTFVSPSDAQEDTRRAA